MLFGCIVMAREGGPRRKRQRGEKLRAGLVA
jgi:hypothetical protein